MTNELDLEYTFIPVTVTTPIDAMPHCPICNAPAAAQWKSESGLSDFARFPCGLLTRNQSAAPGWKRKPRSYCKRDIETVAELRRQLEEQRNR